MKIAYCSDLHFEFAYIFLEFFLNKNKCDVLVLAGDIFPASMLNSKKDNERIKKFFKFISKEYKMIFYVLGNHENYNFNINETETTIKMFLSQIAQNIFILENKFIEF